MKRNFLLFCAALLFSVALAAQENPYNDIRLTVNSENGQFAKGEQIRFSAQALKPIEGELQMIVYEDGIKVNTSPVTVTEEKRVIYECSFNTHKAVHIDVFPASELKGKKGPQVVQSIGAIVAPEEYLPGYDEPEDFLQYWGLQKSAMRESKPNVIREPVAIKGNDANNYQAWSLEISMPEGNPVRGYLVLPKNAKRKSLPIVLFAHSAGVKKPGNKADVKKALSNAKLGGGCISLDMNAHGYLNDQPQEYYDALDAGELKNCTRRPLTTRDDYYFRLMYLRLVRAADYLCSLPEWDQKRFVVKGSSQGGAQGVALAGLDSRVSWIDLSVPAHQDVGSVLQGRKGAWPSPSIKSNPELAAQILPYFDGPNFMRHVNCKVVFEAGLVDMTCPPGCVFASFNVCPSKDKVIYTSPYRPHTDRRVTTESKKIMKENIGKPRADALNEYLGSIKK